MLQTIRVRSLLIVGIASLPMLSNGRASADGIIVLLHGDCFMYSISADGTTASIKSLYGGSGEIGYVASQFLFTIGFQYATRSTHDAWKSDSSPIE